MTEVTVAFELHVQHLGYFESIYRVRMLLIYHVRSTQGQQEALLLLSITLKLVYCDNVRRFLL